MLEEKEPIKKEEEKIEEIKLEELEPKAVKVSPLSIEPELEEYIIWLEQLRRGEISAVDTTLFINKYKTFTSDSDLVVNNAVSVRSTTNPGRVRLSQALYDDERCWGFVGFTKEAVTAVANVKVQIAGIVSGFTGLSPGADYYLTDISGAIGTTAGTYKYRVGIALSATELLLFPSFKQKDTVAVDIINYVIASDTLRNSNDTERSKAGDSTYTKVKETQVNYTGDTGQIVLRIKFDLKSGAAGYSVHAQIYKNGVPIGTERVTNSSTYVTFSEDISNWVDGDLIQLYYRDPSIYGVYIINFRVYCDADKKQINKIGDTELDSSDYLSTTVTSTLPTFNNTLT